MVELQELAYGRFLDAIDMFLVTYIAAMVAHHAEYRYEIAIEDTFAVEDSYVGVLSSSYHAADELLRYT